MERERMALLHHLPKPLHSPLTLQMYHLVMAPAFISVLSCTCSERLAVGAILIFDDAAEALGRRWRVPTRQLCFEHDLRWRSAVQGDEDLVVPASH